MKTTLAAPHPRTTTPAVKPGACAWLLGDSPTGDAQRVTRAGQSADWRRNQLLAAWPASLWHAWAEHAECLYLHRGQVLHEAGAVLQWVYFPVSALVSLSMQDRSGVCSEVASVSREGVVGLPLMEGNYTRSRAEVHVPGRAIRLPARLLADAFAREVAVRQLLLAYSQALVSEIMQTALCSRHHSLEQQLCRLILARIERQTGHKLSMTQEAMATLLGVRRESITLCAARLQQLGLIRYARGHISVLDVPGLHSHGCDCHATLQREFSRLLRPRNSAE